MRHSYSFRWRTHQVISDWSVTCRRSTYTWNKKSFRESIYDETKQDLLKAVTEISQQNLIQYVNFDRPIFYYSLVKKRTAEDIPVFNNIRSTAYRRRSSILPPTPKKIENIIIPDNLKLLENGASFLILDNRCSRPILLGWSRAGSFKNNWYWVSNKFFESYRKVTLNWKMTSSTNYSITLPNSKIYSN